MYLEKRNMFADFGSLGFVGKLSKKCFAGWRRLPVVLREEKERDARREQLRRKVAEILPDFHSSPIDSLWRSVNPL